MDLIPSPLCYLASILYIAHTQWDIVSCNISTIIHLMAGYVKTLELLVQSKENLLSARTKENEGQSNLLTEKQKESAVKDEELELLKVYLC